MHLAPVVCSSKCEGYEKSPENASLRLLRNLPKYLIVPDLLLENPTWPLICSHCHILFTYTLCDKSHFSAQGIWAFQTSVCWKSYAKTCTTSLLAKLHFYIKYCPWGGQGGLAGVIAINPDKPESYPQKLYSKRKALILARCPLTSTHVVHEFQCACKLKCIHTHTNENKILLLKMNLALLQFLTFCLHYLIQRLWKMTWKWLSLNIGKT